MSWVMPRYWHTFFAESFPGKVLMQTPRTGWPRLWPLAAPSWPRGVPGDPGCRMSMDVTGQEAKHAQILEMKTSTSAQDCTFQERLPVVPQVVLRNKHQGLRRKQLQDPNFPRSSVATRLLLPSWTMPRVCDSRCSCSKFRKLSHFLWILFAEMGIIILVPSCS